jgi:hypothetical protein
MADPFGARCAGHRSTRRRFAAFPARIEPTMTTTATTQRCTEHGTILEHDGECWDCILDHDRAAKEAMRDAEFPDREQAAECPNHEEPMPCWECACDAAHQEYFSAPF